ncbi:MmgE/PrpD family protein [Desulfocucumis palustris]|uniref:MmgE/PrpD family protein n=1 Tax=Desulfocucumis palustris TaxID=1898651 RepID=A0A2L2XF62_9FIRM|nr:MmgE/PrpD family protein [Desulfocucumis palustris]GBF32481.1 MmgE/PrpD family protein [Desulfocucumis palustris]
MSENILIRIEQFITRSTFEDLTEEVIQSARTGILDWLGVTVAGAQYPAVRKAIDVLEEHNGSGKVLVLGLGRSLNLLDAACANSIAGHFLDYDDTNMDGLLHASNPTLAALCGLSQKRSVNGRDFITAYVIGYEVAVALSRIAGRRHYDQGWHNSATIGVFGACAAAAKVLGFKGQALHDALGLAGIQAAGLRAAFGTFGKTFQVGKAASGGLLAAFMAEAGINGPPDIFEDKFGFFAAFSPAEGDAGQIMDEMGSFSEFKRNIIKLHACCLQNYPNVEAALQAVSENQIKNEDIAKIDCFVNQIMMDNVGNPYPDDSLGSKFCLPYCIGLAVTEGVLFDKQFSDGYIIRPDIKDIASKVSLVLEPHAKVTDGRVIFHLRDGRVIEKVTNNFRGYPGQPIQPQALRDKFHGLLSNVINQVKVDKIERIVETLEHVPRVSALWELCY